MISGIIAKVISCLDEGNSEKQCFSCEDSLWGGEIYVM